MSRSSTTRLHGPPRGRRTPPRSLPVVQSGPIPRPRRTDSALIHGTASQRFEGGTSSPRSDSPPSTSRICSRWRFRESTARRRTRAAGVSASCFGPELGGRPSRRARPSAQGSAKRSSQIPSASTCRRALSSGESRIIALTRGASYWRGLAPTATRRTNPRAALRYSPARGLRGLIGRMRLSDPLHPS